VRRRSRIDVPEGEDEFIFVNDGRGDFAGADFFKQGLHEVFYSAFLVFSDAQTQPFHPTEKLKTQN